MPKTLLLADDSVTIQKVVGISFANEDVVLLTVDNGDDAIARAREAKPDLVLADVAMPGKDGYEVCEAIKGDPALRHVPVLLLSGTFESFDDDRARHVGADGHITKPFEAQALVDRVNELLAHAEAARPVGGSDTTVLVSERPTAGGDAFDFFDEEFAQTAPSSSATPAAPTALLDDPADSLSSMPIELEAAVEDDEAEDFGEPSESMAVASLDDDRPVSPDGNHATLVFDPNAQTRSPGSAPSLALADLDEPFAPPSGPQATKLMDADDAPAAGAAFDEPFDFGFEDEVETAAPAAPAAQRTTAATERALDPPSHEAPELFASELDEPVAAPQGRSAPPSRAAVEVAQPSGAHVDVLRQELRQHLEKVAWEAFGDLSERIVRETVGRIEAIAWEVIPQMAETLIREEIRKLQDDSE